MLAEHGEAALSLMTPERSVLAEALRRGEDLREQVEAIRHFRQRQSAQTD